MLHTGRHLFARRAASVLFALSLVGCGGRSRVEDATGADGTRADALLWVTSDARPTQLYAVLREAERAVFVGETDGHFSWSPDRRHVFLSRRAGSVIVSMDGSALPIEPDNDLSVAWSPDGERFAFIARQAPAIVSVSDGTSVVVDAAQPGDTGRMAWSPDGSRVAFGLGTSLVETGDDGSRPRVVSTGPLPAPGDQPWALTPVWSPNSGGFAVITSTQELLYVDRQGKPAHLRDDAVTPAFGWSEDGVWFAYRTPDRACVVVAPDGSSRDVTAAGCQLASWSPVNSRLLVNGEGSLSVWTPDSSAPSLLDAAENHSASWSPNGSVIAYRNPDEDGYVFITPEGVRLYQDQLHVTSFHWNGSGTHVGWLEPDASLRATSLVPTPVVFAIAPNVRDFTWLPDGEHLAFADERQISIARANGTEQLVVGELPDSVTAVGWAVPGEVGP